MYDTYIVGFQHSMESCYVLLIKYMLSPILAYNKFHSYSDNMTVSNDKGEDIYVLFNTLLSETQCTYVRIWEALLFQMVASSSSHHTKTASD